MCSSQRKVDEAPRITALATPKPPAATSLSSAPSLPVSPSDRNLPRMVGASMPIPLSSTDSARRAGSQEMAILPVPARSFRARTAAAMLSFEFWVISRTASTGRSPDWYIAFIMNAQTRPTFTPGRPDALASIASTSSPRPPSARRSERVSTRSRPRPVAGDDDASARSVSRSNAAWSAAWRQAQRGPGACTVRPGRCSPPRPGRRRGSRPPPGRASPAAGLRARACS